MARRRARLSARDELPRASSDREREQGGRAEPLEVGRGCASGSQRDRLGESDADASAAETIFGDSVPVDDAGALGSVGLDWTMWTDNAALESANGAVFFMSPDDGPAGEAVVAQFTTAPGWSASLGAQGRSSSGDDWQADGLTFSA